MALSRFRVCHSADRSIEMNRIHIPESLTDILRKFSKAAIQSQPADLLQWSLTYFLALADENGNEQPSEHPTINVGILRVLHSQFQDGTVFVRNLQAAWDSLFLDRKILVQILSLEGFSQKPAFEINWLRFLAQVCRATTQTIEESLECICKVVTKCPAEAEPKIPMNIFEQFYVYLAGFEPAINDDHIEDVLAYLQSHTYNLAIQDICVTELEHSLF